MIIRGIDKGQLDAAMQRVNMHFAGNVKWKRLDLIGESRGHASGHSWRCTLSVVDSRGKGHKISRSCGRERHIAAACWHVHGHFFDAVLDVAPGAVITVSRCVKGKIQNSDKRAGNWQDFNIGSQCQPAFASEACWCAGEGGPMK
jgi:hypothetical protein